MRTVRYTRWDGSQSVRLSADRAFAKFAEYLSYTDDVQEAFDSLLRHGLALDDARQPGVDELLEAVREQMRRRFEQFNLDRALDDVRRRLDDLVGGERDALNEPPAEDTIAAAKRAAIDGLPRRLSEALERLRRHAFENERARGDFERLADEAATIRDLEEFRRRFGELFRGAQSLDYADAVSLMREFLRLKGIEDALVGGNLDAVDADAMAALVGDGAAEDLDRLRRVVGELFGAAYLTRREDRVRLSAQGIRRIGQLALRDIYQSLLRDQTGTHLCEHRGAGELRPDVRKRYRFGDPFHLDLVGTLQNALARRPGTPLRLEPGDFQVYDSFHATTASTVLLLDMSWSMSWEGRFAAAKKVALAMESLIRSRFPKDYFAVVGFYTRAAELKAGELPEASWNIGDPFTNLQDGLRLAGELLARHPSHNEHVIVITDGQPTAYFDGGRLRCEWPLSFGGVSPRAAQETLREVERITRRGIRINTFMLEDNPSLRTFVEKMTRINKGRALFTRPDRLGKYLLVDYLARKRKRV